MASNNGLPSITKLVGRDNFSTWQFAVSNYLEHEGLLKCIDGSETEPEKISKAKTKIILLLDPINYVHVKGCTTAKQVWDKLKGVFDDSGLCRRVSLLRSLLTAKLEDYLSIEEFVNHIMTTAQKLNGIGFTVEEEWIGTLLLAGLPSEYSPMIMGIESSGVKITADSIKTKLLQEVKIPNSSVNGVFYSSSTSSNQKHNNYHKNDKSGIRCYACNLYGHKALDCKKNLQKKKNQANKATLYMSNENGFSFNESTAFSSRYTSVLSESDNWLVDSGASEHYTMRNDWMEDIQAPKIRQMVVANNKKLAVESSGTVYAKVNCEGNSDIIPINGVQYVPSLSVNLLSVSQLVKKGLTVTFNENGCRIINSKGDIVATARMINNVFRLDLVQSQCWLVKTNCVNEVVLDFENTDDINDGEMINVQDGPNQNETPVTPVALVGQTDPVVFNANDSSSSGNENYFSDDVADSEVKIDTTIVTNQQVRKSERKTKLIERFGIGFYAIESSGDPINVQKAFKGRELWRKEVDLSKHSELTMNVNHGGYVNFIGIYDNRQSGQLEPLVTVELLNVLVRLHSAKDGLVKRRFDEIGNFKGFFVSNGCSTINNKHQSTQSVSLEDPKSWASNFPGSKSWRKDIRNIKCEGNLLQENVVLNEKARVESKQLDSVSAFLQGEVNEDLYIAQPKEFANGNKVCRSKKSKLKLTDMGTANGIKWFINANYGQKPQDGVNCDVTVLSTDWSSSTDVLMALGKQNVFVIKHRSAMKKRERLLKGTITAKCEFSKYGKKESFDYCDGDWVCKWDYYQLTLGFYIRKLNRVITWNKNSQDALWVQQFEKQFRMDCHLSSTIKYDKQSGANLPKIRTALQA